MKKRGGIKGYPVRGFVNQHTTNPKIKYMFSVPNCTLDDAKVFLISTERRLEYDEGLESCREVRDLPINTKVIYGKQKTIWPLGARDFVI